MKYCSKCGAELNDNDAFCGSCGAKVGEVKESKVVNQPAKQQPAQPAKPQANWGDRMGRVGLGFAIPTLICGVLSFIPIVGLFFLVIALILGFFGLIFGIIGCTKAVSKGKCITAIILSIVGMTLAIFFYSVILGLIVAATEALA